MLKRIICIILSVIMAVSCFAFCFTASAADDVVDTLVSIVKKFPAGKYWNHMGSSVNNPDGWTNTPCASHSGCGYYPGDCSCNSFENAIQCMGYAYKIAYEITGVSPRSFECYYTLNVDDLRVGDVIRYNGHSICVTGVSGTKIAFTDANWDYGCGIRWTQMDISSIRGFSYVERLKGNNRTNTNLDFYKDVDTSGSTPSTPSVPSAPAKSETWQMSDEDGLNIRSTYSTTAEIVGNIPESAQFLVSEKKISGEYLWGKVYYNGITGWAALNYSEYKSGSYKLPQINNEKSSYTSLKVSLSWDAVDGADKYTIAFFDSASNVIGQYDTTSTSYTMSFSAAGTYQARVYAKSSLAPSWTLKSDVVKFKAANGGTTPSTPSTPTAPKGETWQMNDEGSLNVRSSASTSATVVGSIPANAQFTVTEKKTSTDYLWGKVYYNGVTGWAALNYSTYKSGKYASPEINNEKATYTTAKVSLSWNKVDGADRYKIAFFDMSNKVIAQAYTTATSYTKTFTANGTYQVRVYAVNSHASSWVLKSAIVKFTLKAPFKPADVTGLKQNVSKTTTSSLTFTWNAVSGAAGYDIHRYNASTKKYDSLGSVKTTSFTDNSVKQSSNYYYLVRAYVMNASTKVAGNNVKILCSTDPAGVTGLKQSASSSTSVTLKWNKAANATAYVVYKYNSSTKTYSKVATTTTNTATVTQSANTAVYYRVYSATKTTGGYNYGKVSAAALARTGPAKTSVTLTNIGSGKVEVSWKKVSGATHYQIFRYENGSYKKIATVSSAYDYYNNTGLKRGTNYYYLVRPIRYSSSVTYYGTYSAKAGIKTA